MAQSIDPRKVRLFINGREVRECFDPDRDEVGVARFRRDCLAAFRLRPVGRDNLTAAELARWVRPRETAEVVSLDERRRERE